MRAYAHTFALTYGFMVFIFTGTILNTMSLGVNVDSKLMLHRKSSSQHKNDVMLRLYVYFLYNITGSKSH